MRTNVVEDTLCMPLLLWVAYILSPIKLFHKVFLELLWFFFLFSALFHFYLTLFLSLSLSLSLSLFISSIPRVCFHMHFIVASKRYVIISECVFCASFLANIEHMKRFWYRYKHTMLCLCNQKELNGLFKFWNMKFAKKPSLLRAEISRFFSFFHCCHFSTNYCSMFALNGWWGKSQTKQCTTIRYQ